MKYKIYFFFNSSNYFSFNFLNFILNNFYLFFLFSCSDNYTNNKINFNFIKLFCLLNNLIFFNHKIVLFLNLNFYNFYIFNKLKNIKINISVTFDYGFLLSSNLIFLYKYGFLNIHASLLPIWRGKNPIYNSLLNNTALGFTFFLINKNIDLGKIVCYFQFPVKFYYKYYFLKYKFCFLIFYILLKKLFFLFLINNYYTFNQHFC